MSFEDYNELENSNASPYSQMHFKDFVDGMLKAGSFISMLENKKINTTTLFSLLLENPNYQNFFTEITSSDSFREAITTMLYLNPSLVKSKITKSIVRKINGKSKPANRARKAVVQQASRSLKN